MIIAGINDIKQQIGWNNKMPILS